MLAVTFYDVVLWIHIAGVVIAFGGIFTYPVWFSHVGRAPAATRAGFHRGQAKIGKYVISPGLLVILLAGAYLASDRDLWSEVWVSIPLVILFILGGLGGAYFGPREERLATLAEAGDEAAYRPLFAQVRTVSYVGMALVLIAMFFMVTKLGA